MSSRNWGHGQTFTGGAIAGLALAQHAVLIFVGGVVVGAALVLLARFARRGFELVVDYVRSRRANAPAVDKVPRPSAAGGDRRA